MILGVTAHRPDKLARAARVLAQSTPRTLYEYLDRLITYQLKPEHVITGMALGGDQLIAEICWNHSIPFVAYVPCDGQERLWSLVDQERYRWLLDRARAVVVVSPGPYSARKMQRRNEQIVDDCTTLLAVFDGTVGDTFNTWRYALEEGRHILRLNPTTLVLEELNKAV